MKELKTKTFLTIYSIFSIFVVVILVIFNIQNYNREYTSLERNLNFQREMMTPKNKPNIRDNRDDQKLDNMMIMDYEVYTVRINDNKIDKIINHSNESSDFEVESIANNILESNTTYKIGNLYNTKYAYNYNNNTITIVNTEKISKRINKVLIISLIILLISEVIIYLLTTIITRWLVKPAEEALNKQKDFIADASHELKTPLAVIIASSDELKVDKKNEKYIDNIKCESDRMSKLIKGMLDLSKLESGVTKDSYKEENLSKIVEKEALIFESIAYEQDIKMLTNIDNNITYKCNKDEIERLISILIDNAIKHSYKDSIINVNMHKDKNNIKIEVINTGDPIKREDEEKIFERFYRSDKSRNRSSNRYGLGLAIAKNITINHNGTIKAHSENNKTVFTINFKK